MSEGSPDPAEITALFAVVGERLQRRFDDINRTMNVSIEQGVEGLDAPELNDILHASVEGNISTILHMLRYDIPLSHVQPTTSAIEYAVRLAQRGVPSTSLRRAYHFGSNDLLARAFEEVRQLDISPDVKLSLLHHLAGWIHSYIDWITRTVLQAYDEERRQIELSSASVAASMVHAVLEGQTGSAEGFAERTGYRLQQHHLGAVVWIAASNPGLDQADSLRDLAQELSIAAGSSAHPMFTVVDRSTAWVWFGRGTHAERVDERVFAEVIEAHRGARLALGRVRSGVAGFRRSHAEAQMVRDLLSVARDGAKVAAHDGHGVAQVAMMAHDVDRLAEWVGEVLGPLAAEGEQAARLRETLRVFWRCGANYQATADRLMLHRNTVKYRVGRAEALRGDHPLEADRIDVEIAVEAVALLGDAVLLHR